MNLGLLLAHADDGEPVLREGLPAGALLGGRQDTGEVPDSERLWEHGGEPDDLLAQRWGLVAPEGPEGDRLLALVRCPECRATLTRTGDLVTCSGCGRHYRAAGRDYLDLRPSVEYAEQTRYLEEALHVDARHERVSPPLLP